MPAYRASASLVCVVAWMAAGWGAAPAGGQTLDPNLIPKYAEPLVIPPPMPRSGIVPRRGATPIDYYEIAVRQFSQHILPRSMGLPPTTVWSYGSARHPETFNYPAFTIEARVGSPIRIKWINDLKDPATGAFLPHLLPIDQTLHWANPPGGVEGRDSHGHLQTPYTGPVPIVTHVHGAHTHEESDGYTEAWYLPDAPLPPGYAAVGSFYDIFNKTFQERYGAPPWGPGSATFQYPNRQPAATLWYHDHTLGITRANVYAGPAGFYLLRGGPSDEVLDARTGRRATLPGPARGPGGRPTSQYFEIPLAIQDRSFNDDGSLFYPSGRAFFEGLNEPPNVPYLGIPFAPDEACDGEESDVAPIWNPEFFGNTIVVNGRTWPYLDVEQRRYRFRVLNGCNSRFLILRLSSGQPFWQIGSDGGFLAAPAMLDELLLAPAERADVIVDFAGLAPGTVVLMENLAPDEPFGGGFPGIDFEPADPETTGQVMAFRVGQTRGRDRSTPPEFLVLPALPTPADAPARRLSLNEEDSASVRVVEDAQGNVVLACDDPDGEPFGPVAAKLGVLDAEGSGVPLRWADPTTETPKVGAPEVWEFYNFTADAHPIHIHQVQFRVVGRQALLTDKEGMAVQPAVLVEGTERPPEAWETGYKDTVLAYPGEVTRVYVRFDLPGLFTWHCHILEHEDNEMMRPFIVLP